MQQSVRADDRRIYLPRHLLYLSYAGDGGDNGTGSLLKYDLLRDRIVWQKDYPIGIDSFALSADGRLVFMPGGEADGAPWWYVLRASDGTAVQHTLDGKYVYVGDTGNVYATNSPRLAFTLPTLRDTRKHIEIDWRNGRPVATSTRSGIGHRR